MVGVTGGTPRRTFINHNETVMKQRALLLCILAASWFPMTHAQSVPGVPPVENPDQLSMLESPDPKLARNKKHVFDFWRIVYEGGHMDKAPQYMSEGYIQHNPNVTSGRKAFVELFSKVRKPREVAPRIKVPVISIIAERDIVMVSHVRKVRARDKHDLIYYITWFDVFRIDGDGLIAEHWDSSELWVDGKPPGAEFFEE
jgi:predicted SnoaL-like aldol condensation-catalyzing enzyme